MATPFPDPVARRGTRFQRDAVLGYGPDAASVAAEASSLVNGAGVVPLLGMAAHAVTGRDARGFLHRMLTQDVKSLAAGAARPALFLDARGRVQGDPVVWSVPSRPGSSTPGCEAPVPAVGAASEPIPASGRRSTPASNSRGAEWGGEPPKFLLVEEPAAAAKAMPALERYVIADDVTIADESAAWGHLLLLGARSESVAAAAARDLAAIGALAARADWRGRPAFRVLVPADRAGEALGVLGGAGAVAAGEEALDVARVETLWPWFGAELDDRVLPNEAALDAAISWTKGCYLGQEPVVMAKHRGHPPSLLVRLVVGAGPRPVQDAAVVLAVSGAAARPVGRVATAVEADVSSGIRGHLVLAFVRYEHARVGETLALEDGRGARVEAVAGVA